MEFIGFRGVDVGFIGFVGSKVCRVFGVQGLGFVEFWVLTFSLYG